MQTLISVDELFKHLDHSDSPEPVENPQWFVFDCRFSLADANQGENLYKESHIPGALYAHLNRDLSSEHLPGKTGRHPLPDKNDWLETIRTWGVEPDCRVVAYDEGAGAFAARLWWMFRWAGHANVFVLDGGLAAWQAGGHAVDDAVQKAAQEEVTQSPVKKTGKHQFQLQPALTRTMEADELIKNAGKMTLIDARTRERFDGITEPVDPVAGHIPGAVCAPFQENLGADQKFRTPAELRQRFKKLSQEDASQNNPVVCYCGSGVTAAHNILALVHAGFDEPYLYPGSWSEWITDPDRPLARG